MTDTDYNNTVCGLLLYLVVPNITNYKYSFNIVIKNSPYCTESQSHLVVTVKSLEGCTRDTPCEVTTSDFDFSSGYSSEGNGRAHDDKNGEENAGREERQKANVR